LDVDMPEPVGEALELLECGVEDCFGDVDGECVRTGCGRDRDGAWVSCGRDIDSVGFSLREFASVEIEGRCIEDAGVGTLVVLSVGLFVGCVGCVGCAGVDFATVWPPFVGVS